MGLACYVCSKVGQGRGITPLGSNNQKMEVRNTNLRLHPSLMNPIKTRSLVVKGPTDACYCPKPNARNVLEAISWYREVPLKTAGE